MKTSRFGGQMLALIAASVSALLLAGSAAAAPPSNDSFSAAQALLPATGTRSGSNLSATKETNEPSHAGNVGGASVWYQWTAPSTGNAQFDTVGSGFNTLLAVYTGPSVDQLTLVAQNDDAAGTKWTSRLGFAATQGTTYYIAIDGYNGGTAPAQGTFALNWDLVPAQAGGPPNDNFAAATVIAGPSGTTTGSSFGATKETGEPSHAGNAGGHSVWLRWTAPYAGTFSFSTDPSQFNTLLAVYSGIAVDSLVQVAANDDIASNNARSAVTFTATGGTTYSIAIDGKKFDYSGAASGNYVLTWLSRTAAPSAPANNLFASAQQLSGASGAVSGTTVGATKEPGEPSHAGNAGGASVWYTWTAPVSANVDLTTAGSDFDTLLAVYTGTSVSALAPVAANDDSGQTKGPSEVIFAATAGTTYRIAVDGYLAPGTTWAAAGNLVLAWSVGAAAAPANDSFATATTMTGIGGAIKKSTLGATKETDEPNHAGNAGGASVWFRWTAPADGQWRFYTSGSTFNTLLGIYTGAGVGALTLAGSNDDVSATDRSSSVTFVARAGTTYYVAVDGYRGPSGPAASGDFWLSWKLLGADPALAPNDDFASAWPLTGQTGAVTAANLLSTKQPGEPNHAGNPGGASVWFSWTAPATGYVSFDTPGSSFDTMLAAYTGTSLADLQQVAANDDIQYNRWWPDGRYRESFLSFVAQQGVTYYVAVDGKAAPGGAPARGSIYLQWYQGPPATEKTLLAAGEIHAACDSTSDDQTAQLLAQYPKATIAADGDLADPGSTDAAFATCYAPTWGTLKSATRPAVGNHEYDYSPTASPYFTYFGSAAGAKAKGYYSYELGAWHVVVLNSMCSQIGGCGPGSDEYSWLQQDLTANVNSCTLAYWNAPLFASSSADPPTSDVQPFWNLLYQYGADVVVNAHARQYERFAPMAPDGTVDLAQGIREFVVGTGGAALVPGTFTGNSELLNGNALGVLKLTLRTGSYAWQFLPVAGSTFTDSGQGVCTGGSTANPTAPAAAPPAPVPSVGLSSSGQFGLSWGPSSDLSSGATYTLFARPSTSATWSQVTTGLTDTSYAFAAGSPEAEGTWVFRVQAAANGRVSAYSADSTPVVVDTSAPLPPSLTPDRPAEYAAGSWWKDQVTVTETSNGDAQLADGTTGSGVDAATISAPVTYNTDGTFTATGQLTDRAGNSSQTTSLSVNVDTTQPQIAVQCADVKLGATASATFQASDTGSGLATPATGTVLEDSSTAGTQTITVNALDNVGHSQTAACTYTVTTPPAPSAPVPGVALSSSGQFGLSWDAPDLPAGATYTLFRRPASSTTWSQVAAGLSTTSYTFRAGSPQTEGTWVYRVQASVNGSVSPYSPASTPVVVDTSPPRAPSLTPDRPADYPAGGWWKDQVTVTETGNGDTLLVDGSAGSGVDPATINAPVTYNSDGTFTATGRVGDLAGNASPSVSLLVKVDTTQPQIAVQCADVKLGATASATFQASDTGSGLATPATGTVPESSSSTGIQTLTVAALDNVGHRQTATCTYNVTAAAAPPAPTTDKALVSNGQFKVTWKASPDLPTGASYTLYERSTAATSWRVVASGLNGTSYSFDAAHARPEGTWVYRVQAAASGKTSDYSAASAPVVVDTSAPLTPSLTPDRPAEYSAGGWWKDQVTITEAGNGDAQLADGTPGSGVDPASIHQPWIVKTGTLTIGGASGQVTDLAGWKSPSATLTVKVDATAPTITLNCGDVKQGATFWATYQAKDGESGLATPASGVIAENSVTKGSKTLSVSATDNVGHVTTKTCTYNVQ